MHLTNQFCMKCFYMFEEQTTPDISVYLLRVAMSLEQCTYFILCIMASTGETRKSNVLEEAQENCDYIQWKYSVALCN